MKLSTRVHRIFHTAWDKLGRPEMKVIKPVAEWTLPIGYTYDESTDTIVDEDGATVTDVAQYQTFDMVPYMPGGIEFTVRGQQDQNLVMTPAGLASNMIIVGRTLPEYLQTLKESFAVEIDGDLYDMNGANCLPEGSSDKAWVNITLRRR